MLKVKGIHRRSPNTSMKPNLSAIISHLQNVTDRVFEKIKVNVIVEMVIFW